MFCNVDISTRKHEKRTRPAMRISVLGCERMAKTCIRRLGGLGGRWSGVLLDWASCVDFVGSSSVSMDGTWMLLSLSLLL